MFCFACGVHVGGVVGGSSSRGFFSSHKPPNALLPSRAETAASPANESTISITNTAWERALDDLKKDLDTLKAEGGMGPLRKLLQMKVEELERVRQSEPGARPRARGGYSARLLFRFGGSDLFRKDRFETQSSWGTGNLFYPPFAAPPMVSV